MPGLTDTQAIRYGYVTDPIDWTMVRDEADDIAVQLDAADTQAAAVLQSPVAAVTRFSALAVAVATPVSVPWTSEVQDTHAMVDIAGQPNRFTVSSAAGAGLYFVQFQMQTDTTGWTRGDIILNKNAAQYARKTFRAPQSFGRMQFSAQVYLGSVGDFVTFQVSHEGGGTTNTTEIYGYIYKVANN